MERNGWENFNVNKLMEVLSEILSEKYGCKITMTAIPKDQAPPELLERDAELKRKREAELNKTATKKVPKKAS